MLSAGNLNWTASSLICWLTVDFVGGGGEPDHEGGGGGGRPRNNKTKSAYSRLVRGEGVSLTPRCTEYVDSTERPRSVVYFPIADLLQMWGVGVTTNERPSPVVDFPEVGARGRGVNNHLVNYCFFPCTWIPLNEVLNGGGGGDYFVWPSPRPPCLCLQVCNWRCRPLIPWPNGGELYQLVSWAEAAPFPFLTWILCEMKERTVVAFLPL